MFPPALHVNFVTHMVIYDFSKIQTLQYDIVAFKEFKMRINSHIVTVIDV